MKNRNSFKIYVFHYKPDKIIADAPEYAHIWAGKNGKPQINGFLGDDTGDNISDKNRYYSELTGLYWIWKNSKSDIIGSCHYRRYFTTAKKPTLFLLKQVLYFPIGIWRSRFGIIHTQNLKFWNKRLISENEAVEILKDFDAILPVRRKLKLSIKDHYNKYHNIEDLKRIEELVGELYPEYSSTFSKVLKEDRMFANNMFILKWEAFDKLMEWLFSILFKFEKEINLDDYQHYQERIFGFLSERLITVWIAHNNIKYKELPLVYFKKLKVKLDA
jgi:hypothetical protein